MRTSRSLLTALLLALSSSTSFSAKLRVPDEFRTPQEAVDAAAQGDEIVIRGGPYAGPLWIVDKLDLTVRGKGSVVIDAAGVSGSAVLVNRSSGILLENLVARDAGQAAFDIFDSHGVLLRKCVARNAGDYGFYVAHDSREVAIVDCHVRFAALDGIRIHFAARVQVVRSEIRGAGDAGVKLTNQSSSCVLLGNRIEDNVTAAALSIDGSGHLLEQNGFFGSDHEQSIELRGSDHTLLGNLLPGALDVHGSGHLLHSNRINNSRGSGIWMEDVTGCHLIQNRIRSSQEGGIYLHNSSGCVLAGNRVTRPGGSGILILLGSTQNLLIENQIRRSPSYGLVLGATAPGNTILRNTARQNRRADLSDFNPPYSNTFLENRYETSESLP